MQGKTVGRLLLLFFVLLSTAFSAEPPPGGSTHQVEALTIYQQGKALYDAGDYPAARSKFLEAAKREPTNPRWFYNLGLVHRQMDNFQAARQSFMRVRELAPDYKRTEIDDKLASMGFDPAASAEAQPVSQNSRRDDGPDFSDGLIWVAVVAGVTAAIFFVFRRRSRPGIELPLPAPDPARVRMATQRLDELARQLVAIEHAMRLGEDPDLRAQLDYATGLEDRVRKGLTLVRRGEGAALNEVEAMLDQATAAAVSTTRFATDRYGEAAFAGKGESVGCFFCARPLANADYRHRVEIKRDKQSDTVLACPPCAERSGRSESVVRTSADGDRHWSEQPDFDPYAGRHADPDGAQSIPAWRLQPDRPVGELARLAAGGALLAGGAGAAAMAAAAVFDMNAAREAGLAREAAQAAAGHAAGQRRGSLSGDHS